MSDYLHIVGGGNIEMPDLASGQELTIVLRWVELPRRFIPERIANRFTFLRHGIWLSCAVEVLQDSDIVIGKIRK
jgi:hypothetical protein